MEYLFIRTLYNNSYIKLSNQNAAYLLHARNFPTYKSCGRSFVKSEN